MDSNIIQTYERLKKEYKNYIEDDKNRLRYNPVKNTFELGEHKNVMTKTLNVMSAKTENGVFTKAIAIDDEECKSKENIIYVSNDMETYFAKDIGLTTIRCALMACLSFETLSKPNPSIRIGFIGNGKINIKTAEYMNYLFGIQNIVIRGSKRDRAKNKLKFENVGMKVIVDDTEDLLHLNECDVIVCCTSSYSKEDMISYNDLNKPRLFIVQDSGYLLDKYFRKNMVNFTDHKEQLYAHFKEEFPFDDYETLLININDKLREKDLKKAVYLYGIALADAIVFEEMFLEGVKDARKKAEFK